MQLLNICVTSAALENQGRVLTWALCWCGMDRTILLPTKANLPRDLYGGAVFLAYEADAPGHKMLSSVTFTKYAWIEWYKQQIDFHNLIFFFR